MDNLRAQQWYNGQAPRNLSGYLNDKSTRLIGWATLRQLRIKTEPCQKQLICRKDYSVSDEERANFAPAWQPKNTNASQYSSSIYASFRYVDGDQLDSYAYAGDHQTYRGGGYVYELRGRLADLRANLSQLRQLQWIDDRTRAVIIQFPLYNPNVQLFTSATLLVEFLSNGGLYPQSRFEPLSFQSQFVYSCFHPFILSLVFTSMFQLICILLYLILIIYLLIRQIQSLCRLKWNYFRQFWSYIDLGIVVCSCLASGTYVVQYREARRIGSLFQQSNGFAYINLQRSAYVNDLQNVFLAFACFFAFINILRLGQYHRRLRLFTDTLRHASRDLLSFMVMFSVVFIAFLSLFYFIFISSLRSCATLLQTARMLFEMSLMKFDAHELVTAQPILGPISFALFILVIVFVCMSMFITIISESFRFVRDNAHLQSDDGRQLLAYLFRKCGHALGTLASRPLSWHARALLQVYAVDVHRINFSSTISKCAQNIWMPSNTFLTRLVNYSLHLIA